MNITGTVPTLEQRIIGTIRLKHYSRKTEVSYVQWYKRYVHFQKEVCGKMRHPAEMGAPKVEAFLTHLAVNRDLAAASQNQALNALIFLYRDVLKIELDGIQATRAKSVRHLPVVLTVDEVRELLAVVKGDSGLAVKLLYDCEKVTKDLSLSFFNPANACTKGQVYNFYDTSQKNSAASADG